jgi:hypothetical protein
VLQSEIAYHVVLVREEDTGQEYHRAWLLNVALAHISQSFSNDTCVVFHDLDLLPSSIETSVNYAWCEQPTLVCSELSCFNNSVPFKEYSGGVVVAKLSDWKEINGLTDSAYDWDGEDEDMYWRFRFVDKLQDDDTLRKPITGHGRCDCLDSGWWTHQRKHSYLEQQRISDRIARLSSASIERVNTDKSEEWRFNGLNSLSFEIQEQVQDDFGSTWLHATRPAPVIDNALASHFNTTDDRQQVVLLFAYRDREKHYHRMMAHLRKLQQRVDQTWDFHVFVVEQLNDDLFRKGWLLNVGFREIAKLFDGRYTCVVQHDIDLLPNLDTVNYGWCDVPTQVCTDLPCFPRSDFPYDASAGGVMTAKLDDWITANGYTNQVYGWGGEDDELFYRFRESGLLEPPGIHVRRPPEGDGYCDCNNARGHTPRVSHGASYRMITERINSMKTGNSTDWKRDGYSNTTYEVVSSFIDEYGSAWLQVNYSSPEEWSPTSCVDSNGPIPVSNARVEWVAGIIGHRWCYWKLNGIAQYSR